MGGKSIWGVKVNGNQTRGHNSGQNNYHTTTFLFQGKVTFMVTFKEKIVFLKKTIGFKRTYINCSLIMIS